MKLKRRGFGSTSLIILVCLILLSSSWSAITPPTRSAPAPSAAKPTEDVFDFAIHAPYWSTEPGFVSTLQMKNYRVDEPLMVTPVLYPLGGRQIKLDSIRLNPSETQVLNINEALAARGEASTIGAVEIRYRHATEGVFGANLSVVNETQSLIYSFPLRSPQGTKRLEGVWWFWDADTDGFVAVHNTSAIAITVTPTLYVKERPYRLDRLQLQPHEMRLIPLRQELGNLGLEAASEGGIQLEASIPGTVVAGGALVNPAIGFSSEIRLGDPRLEAERVRRLANGRTLHALNVPIGAASPEMGLPAGTVLRPIMILRNVTGAVIRVQPVFKYQVRNSQRSLALPDLQLRPQQTERVELLSYWLSGQIPQEVAWGSLEIGYEGSLGPLVAAVTSVDDTGTYVLDARIDNRLGAGFEGVHWSLEGENNTFVTVKNITRNRATFWLMLQYNRGREEYEMEPVTLQAGETRVINLKRLQMERIPDANGKLLPEWATFGGLSLVEEPGGRHVLMEIAVFNPRTATCGPCGSGCVYVTRLVTVPSLLDLLVGDLSNALTVRAQMCTGAWQDGWECECVFESDNPPIATVNPYCTHRGTGMSPGETLFQGPATVPAPWCGEWTLIAFCDVTVRPPEVSISSAQSIMDGDTATFSVTVQGGTPTAYQWSFTAPSAGNNPNVTFSPNGSAMTTTNGHWFALPDAECGAAANAVYTIRCTVTFSDGPTQTVETTLTVNGYWSPAGMVDPNELEITGSPTAAPDANGVWRITGMGSLARRLPMKQVYVSSSSQFFMKVDAHEQEHLNHFQPGNLFGNILLVSDFYDRIKDFTASTQQALANLVVAEYGQFQMEQFMILEGLLGESENRAYQVSDPIAPQYLYQKSCNPNL
jgi:hypothetical protein